jgi:hypothetical protein
VSHYFQGHMEGFDRMKQLVFMKGWYGFENDRYRRNKLALTEDQQIVFPSMLEYFLEFL